jgi:signal transduction histidine kinase
MLQGIKLIAADDDEMSLEMLATMLAGSGVHCTTVPNGRKAMEVLESDHGTDIMLLDLQMPVMDGFEVLSQCKGNSYLKDIPIIVLAANRDEKLKALKLGADDFLAKPYDLDELELRISRLVIARRRAQIAKRAKDEFLAVASHELRTPMHVIIGLSELLNFKEMDSNQREVIDRLKDATWGLTETIRNIINYVRLDEGSPEAVKGEFSLREMVGDAVHSVKKHATEKGCELALEIAEGTSDTLVGTPFYLHKVITILVENAVKFSSGGTIRIAINEESLGSRSSRFCCSVSDDGIGIPSEFHEKIFEPFVQVDGSATRKYGGIGLGLSVARRMVEMMGGTIIAQSEPGKGSLFRFTFHSDLQNR